jgi:CHAD domain-containing protein
VTQIVVGAESSDARTQQKLGKALEKRRRRARRKDSSRIEKRAAEFDGAVRERLPLYEKLRSTESDRTRESHLLAFVDARIAEKRALVETLFDGLRMADRAIAADRLHAVRVAVKHWRYATEIGRAVMPRVLYRPLVSRLRLLQEIGGKGQDFADLERIAETELDRMDVPARSRRPLLARIRKARRTAATEFLEALGSRLPAPQAISAG